MLLLDDVSTSLLPVVAVLEEFFEHEVVHSYLPVLH